MHSHDHGTAGGGGTRRRLIVALTITATFAIAEVVGALITGSLTLLADAGHMLSDSIGLVVAVIASVVAARPATDRSTFGYRRAEVFGALLNSLVLLGIAVLVAVEGISRLLSPEPGEVLALPMLVIAVLGLAVNAVSLGVLRGGRVESINVRGAYLEVLGDMLGSVAAIIAAIVILTTGFASADAIASLAVAAMILPRAILLLRDVMSVLNQSVPTGTSVADIRAHILESDGVVDVHDVHVWAITTGAPVFTAHVVVDASIFESGRTDELLDSLTSCLSHHFDVEHSTFQLEPATHAGHEHAAGRHA
ncbi:cation diffusion facilitator family transporter [Herbiconiux sp. L3-i23]|uniref:cation diffusion facilitator family transporter n=1 Tax=Herbiconiux sp. L3-i23 TaxID=2905871 RepID=UPI002063A138|nr:cation diffusion facilitator family transporter [Herbiconiux sp. L3-i23]BDI23371.1 cation transporter [Herbiconiux sp. L3-i23]